MSFVNALALVLCVIGGFLTYLCLGPLAGWIFIWAIFIATATGVALGGTPEAFKNLVVCVIAGTFFIEATVNARRTGTASRSRLRRSSVS